jgi:putative ABC transport system permease protein
MRLQSGRDFADADRARTPHVVIINEQLSRLLFPGESAIGRRIGVGGGDAQGDWHEIIGVVADVKHQALDVAPAPRVYDLFGQHWGRTLYVVARSRTAQPAPLLNNLRRRVASLNPEVPVFDGATLQTLVDRSAAARRLTALIASGLALAGVLLALIGVHALTAASVAERTREMGVRAALGAAPGDLLRLIAAEGARPVVWGGVAGAVASVMLARILATQLFAVDITDVASLTGLVVVGVILAAFLAAIPPARRAAGADPLVAMRFE